MSIKLNINNKGISLVEISFSLIALSILLLFINNYFTVRSHSLESVIISGKVKDISSGLDKYIRNIDESEIKKFPYAVKNSELIDKGFISGDSGKNSLLLKNINSYIFRLNIPGNGFSGLAGITFLCMKGLDKSKYLIFP